MSQILFSIIIPVRHTTKYLRQTLKFIKKQTLPQYEVLVIDDKLSTKYSKNPNHTGPAFKRNLGAKLAQGQYLAFLDDDSYPDKNWLKNTLTLFQADKDIAAICGPCLTPPDDNRYQQASGLVWSSFFGSGGAGCYRNSIHKSRFVDDFPSVNLIVKKNIFLKAGSFDHNYWPGEDTVLCLKITKELNKKILYHPTIQVFHHRRPVIWPHLQQLKRYAIQRGYFVKVFPQTSFRLGYFLPSFFFLYIILLPFLLFFHHFLPLIPLYLYTSILVLTFINFIIKGHHAITSLLASATIPITHLYYGMLFLFGLSKKNNLFVPHQINIKTGEYVGG